jgi:hypothetical protein
MISNSPVEKLSWIGVFGLGVMLVGALINTPLQIVTLGRHHATPGRRSGSFLKHLSIGGQAAVWMVLVMVILPLVLLLAAIIGV